MKCGKSIIFLYYLINIIFYCSTIFYIILSINFNSNVDLENNLYNNKIDKLNIKNKYIIFKTKIE
jgi:hypothetical protein